MRGRFIFWLVASLAVMAPCWGAVSDHNEIGEKLYQDTCAACHGENGTGGHKGGPNIIGEASRKITDQDILAVIRLGRPDRGMPAFENRLSIMEVLAVGVHLRHLQGIEIEPGLGTAVALDPLAGLPKAEREAISRGRKVFEGPARCFECHSIRNDGGREAPDLTHIAERMTPAQIRESIVNPSLTIARGYKVLEIVTRDGTKIRGWSRQAKPGALQIYNPEEQLWTTYFTSDLKSKRVSPESLMPADLLDGLSSDQTRDLMTFLHSLQ